MFERKTTIYMCMSISTTNMLNVYIYIYVYMKHQIYELYLYIYIYIHIYKEKQLCYITSGKQMIISTNNMCIYKEKLQKRYMYILFKVFL